VRSQFARGATTSTSAPSSTSSGTDTSSDIERSRA
jgi:hypothetical protein